jgi:catalase
VSPGKKWNAFDVTLNWPKKDHPPRTVGVLTLNRNVQNHFNETEQSAFCPGRLVPGIEVPVQDINLQGRTFAYADAQVHRVGINMNQLPINSPKVRSLHSNDSKSGQIVSTGDFRN